MSPLSIGGVRLDHRVILAPMAGVSDLPFRLLCREQGAAMVCTEMISAKAILYGNKNTEALMAIHPKEGPVSLQLFGSDPEIVSEMAKRIEERPFAVLDLNMGCPVPKVVNNGEGSALMKNPVLAGAIIEKTVRAIQKPVTVKIRKGFDDEHVNAVEIARIAQESGAAAVTVHGRTRQQFYSGTADWDIIAQVKQAVRIPVLGNGDVTDAQTAVKRMEQTGCDGVLVGRAAQGNPWIFSQIAAALEGRAAPEPPDNRTRYETVVRHARMAVRYKGEKRAVPEMRKHLAWYTAGMPHSSRLRRRINELETLEELIESMRQIFLLPV